MKHKVVLATGVFDIIHPGHIFYLNESKKFGHKLFVIVANDINVLKKKGKAPAFNHFDRKTVLENLKMVDKVIIGSENDFIGTAAKLRPDVISFGWDQKFDEKKLAEEFLKHGLTVQFVRVGRFQEYSSTKVRSKIVH